MGHKGPHVVRGIDERPVVSSRERKSVGAERTNETDLYELDLVREKLTEVISIMWNRCKDKQKEGKTLTIKLRFSDFTTITRSSTQQQGFTLQEIKTISNKLLPLEEIQQHGVRLLGATLSNFQSNEPKYYAQLKIDFD